MNVKSLELASTLWNSLPPAAASHHRPGWRPRLRRWLKKLKQYGRLQIEVDLKGVLQL